jgi:MFS transporter, SHS family, lactate transporter
MKAEREATLANGSEGSDKPAARAWLKEFASGLRSNWVLFAYLVILMTGYNSSSHGSQDLYPTFLKSRK